MIDEIRLHGQGGQGVVAAGELIAIAASYEGKFCRAFPLYGSQRRGAPVLSFAQIGDESEASRSMIYNPRVVIVFDAAMPETTDVTEGITRDGVVVMNTPRRPGEAAVLLRHPYRRLATVDATALANRVLGRPIPNTVMLGAFAKATRLLKLESIGKAIEKRFPAKLATGNKAAVKIGYDLAEVTDP